VSREALSLEISNLVSRVVRGESIDIAQMGAALAAKYPELGMSGALIGQAVERAVGMVGMIRSAPAPTKRMPRAVEMVVAPVNEPPAPNGHAFAEPRLEEQEQLASPQPAVEPAVAAELPVARSIDDDLAAEIDAEIGNLVSGKKARPERQVTSNTHPSRTGAGTVPTSAMMAQVARGSNPAKRGSEHGSIFSSFRRVLFRT
jgi:hypothetical protein